MNLSLSEGFGEKFKHTELPLNFIQNQYFSYKNPFSLHYSQMATTWTSQNLFLKFSLFKGTLSLKFPLCLDPFGQINYLHLSLADYLNYPIQKWYI